MNQRDSNNVCRFQYAFSRRYLSNSHVQTDSQKKWKQPPQQHILYYSCFHSGSAGMFCRLIWSTSGFVESSSSLALANRKKTHTPSNDRPQPPRMENDLWVGMFSMTARDGINSSLCSQESQRQKQQGEFWWRFFVKEQTVRILFYCYFPLLKIDLRVSLGSCQIFCHTLLLASFITVFVLEFNVLISRGKVIHLTDAGTSREPSSSTLLISVLWISKMVGMELK